MLLSVSRKTPLAPNPGDDFVPGNNLVLVLKQQDKDLQRNALQLQHMIAATQPPGTQVKLIAFAEPDRLLHSDWVGSHGTHPGKWKEFYTTFGTSV